MSVVNSVGYDKFANNKFVPRGSWGQPVKGFLDEYEAVALESGSTIKMFRPPKGAKYAGRGQLAWDDLGSAAATISVGIAGAVDKFLAATDVQSAADKADLDAGAGAISALGYEFDGETDVILTTAGGNATTGTIKLLMDILLPI
jgi:hypothetical protein